MNLNAVQLWTVGLCVALGLVVLSLIAIFALMRKRQPIVEEDPLRQSRIAERLAKIGEPMAVQPRKRLERAS
jgi:hypothetical protein